MATIEQELNEQDQDEFMMGGMGKGTSVYLLPEEIEIDEIGDRGETVDMVAIEALAQSIKEVGQLEPCVLDGELLVAGRRRHMAIAMINSGLKKSEVPLKVWCVQGNGKGDGLQTAVHENIHRLNYNPVEFAGICKQIRAKHGWEKPADTKKVAKYLAVSPAQVTQHEKMVDKLTTEQLAEVANGRLSAQAAFDLCDVKLEKRQAVVAKAQEKQAAEKASKPATTKAAEKPEPEALKSKHIRAAARETEDALEKAKPLSRGEIIDWFDAQDGPGAGHENGAVRQFLRYAIDKFFKGEGTEKTMQVKWDNATVGADKGTPKPEPKPAPKPAAKKAAKSKAKS